MLALGEIAKALSLAEEGLGLCKESGDMYGRTKALLVLGDVATAQKDYSFARASYEESLALARESLPDPQFIAAGLERLAEVVMAQGEPGWAARLWGAAEAVQEASNFPLTHDHPDRYERAVATAQVQLGKQAFAAAWAEGRTMSLEQVMVAPARHTTPQIGTTSMSTLSSGK